MATLDVLIPHYNDPVGLDASIASVAAQAWTGDLRVVVVDDGSEPALRKRARAIIDACGMPALFMKNAENRGRPYTRNRLLDSIDAPYVAWLDAGDLWRPEKIARQFDAIARLRHTGQTLETHWITCDYDWRWIGGKARHVVQRVDQDQIKALLMGDSLRAYLWTILAPSRAMRAVGWFDERLPRLQDLDFFLRFVAAGGALVKPAEKKPLALYEKSDIGRNALEIRACNSLVFEKHQSLYQRYGNNFMRMRRLNAELLSARYARNNDDWVRLAYFGGRAFAAHPRLVARHLARGDIRL